MMYLFLIVGFVLLVKGADFFVDGSSSVARLLKVPSLIVGLTIVAMGTSAPEASVSITAALKHSSGLSVGNIVGSNMFNLLVVIGVSALISPFVTDRQIVKRDLPVNAAMIAVLAAFCADGKIGRIEGAVLLVGMIVYIIALIINAIKSREEGEDIKTLTPLRSILYIAGGIFAIIMGGNVVVDSATDIAKHFGLSDTIIGLTIVAVGTSLPELVTSVVAAKKGESALSLGNAVGSCMFNVLFILGASSIITPQTITADIMINCVILLFVSVLLWIIGKSRERVTRFEGLVCVLLYIAYTIYLIMTV